MEPTDPRDLIVASRARRLAGAVPAHADADLRRIRRGFYRPRDVLLSSSQDYLLRIFATAGARGGDIVFSHASAAALWGAPLLSVDMAWVHVTRPGKAQRKAAGVMVHRHPLRDDDVLELHGLRVTSLTRTMVDVAATTALPSALVPLDRLLGLAHGDPLEDPAASTLRDSLLEQLGPRARGARVLRQADARSGSAGESLSRGQMHLIGVPPPELQSPFPRLDRPGVDVVDFDWPELGTFGEFDGEAKYFDPAMIGDRDPREVLWQEKLREDRLRRHRPRAVRWDWATALSAQRLAARLASVGIVPQRIGAA